jgi:hypothetical protein
MILRNVFVTVLTASSLMVPAVCNAENTTTWSMMNQDKVEGWNTVNLTTVNLIPQGLAISTETTGQLVRVSKFRHSVDKIGITYISPAGGGGLFFWRAPGMAEDQAFQIPISFNVSTTQQQTVLDMGQVPEWDARSDRIGFVLDAGSQVILQEITFIGPSFADKIIFPLKTFFDFDQMRAYSINFLWGPMMTFSDEQRAQLYTKTPPLGDSWNIVFYWVLGIALLLVLLIKKIIRRNHFGMFFMLFAALWILYDFRMGSELIHFARTDLKIWWSKPIEIKDYRDRDSFTAFANVAQKFTEGKENYVFIASHGWPFWGSMTYESYPALPVTYDSNTEGVDTWIIFNRNDITVNDEGRLMINGKPTSPPGDIMMTFEPGSFVFVTR